MKPAERKRASAYGVIGALLSLEILTGAEHLARLPFLNLPSLVTFLPLSVLLALIGLQAAVLAARWLHRGMLGGLVAACLGGRVLAEGTPSREVILALLVGLALTLVVTVTLCVYRWRDVRELPLDVRAADPDYEDDLLERP